MIQPPYLEKGDFVGFVAPAGIVKTEEIDPAIEMVKEWGLEVVKGKHLYSQHNFFAGDERQRLEDFQFMLDNPKIKAIFCARGGYGSIKIIENLNFSNFINSPKWVVGYSDITLFHICLNQLVHCESIHGIMPKNFIKGTGDNQSLPSLQKALFGQPLHYEIENKTFNKTGKAEGIVTGGNLSVLYSLQATNYELDSSGKILFIEDVNEYVYHLDRMVMNLKLSGKLSKLNGLIIGGMTNIKNTTPGYGKSANEIIANAVREYNYPVIFDFPAGHMYPNLALYMGRKIKMDVSSEMVVIKY